MEYINKVQESSQFVIETFLQFLTKVFDKCWDRAKERNNFEAYNELLLIILDILIKIPFSKMSPALFESMAYNLGEVSSYIGSSRGQSYAANGTWNKYKINISDTTKKELLLYI